MKVYAKQIAPEYQESPLYLFNEFPEDINVFGNSRMNEHCSDVFNRVWNALYNGELLDALDDLKRGCGYNSWSEALEDIIPPEGRAAYTRNERKNIIPEIAERFSNCPSYMEESIVCDMLEVVTGEKWLCNVIHGTCQGEWQNIIYKSDSWTPAALERFEAEYFNTGTEWIVHDEDSAPECAEDISGFSVYCYGWNDDQIRAEIRDAYGAADDAEVLLYKFNGYVRTHQYKLAI